MFSEHSILLAVDQQLGEGAALRVAPELADRVGSLEVGEHEDVEPPSFLFEGPILPCHSDRYPQGRTHWMPSGGTSGTREDDPLPL